MKNDKFSQARGGWSRVLEVCCEKCSGHICYYQKDGPGPLKRMYVDRFIDAKPDGKVLECQHCSQELGLKIIYKKENRAAYRLFESAVKKKIVPRASAKFERCRDHESD